MNNDDIIYSILYGQYWIVFSLWALFGLHLAKSFYDRFF